MNVLPAKRLTSAAQDKIIQRPHTAKKAKETLEAVSVGPRDFICSPLHRCSPDVVERFQEMLECSKGVEKCLNIRM